MSQPQEFESRPDKKPGLMWGWKKVFVSSGLLVNLSIQPDVASGWTLEGWANQFPEKPAELEPELQDRRPRRWTPLRLFGLEVGGLSH